MTKRFDPQCADTAALAAEYRDAAVTHRAASRDGKFKVANKAHARLVAVIRALRGRDEIARELLLPLLEDEITGVRAWAAVHALEFAPKEAEAVLEEIAAGPKSLEELSAKLVLQQWRDGTFAFP